MSLAPKAFDVLRYLVEHADRLVTQDEILEALWPETYVNPEVVKKYVLGIRKVLGDQSNKPAFVATFPRRGYQFIAPVRDEMSSSFSEALPDAMKTIVGREGALVQLDDAFTRVSHGQRQIVFVTGEAGIGKTTLVDVFSMSAAFGAKANIVRGHCVEGFGGKEAYYPVLEALGHLLRDTDQRSNLETFSKRAPTWLVQFPDLIKAEQREALEKEIVGATRERMVREICEALEAITAQNPLVLCLEDLHWVDPSTLDFVSALARRRGPAKLLLVGTYRPADVIISQNPLKALKQDLQIHNLSREIALERLEESHVAAYLAMEFEGGSLPAGLANVIYRHSGGNALFMVTILQDMVKTGVIARSDGDWTLGLPIENIDLTVPETLDQLIETQFQNLSALEQRVLRSASVAGECFSVWSITAATELEPDVIEDTCEGLVERLQFIEAAGLHELSNGELSCHYEFRHSLYREVLYRRLSESSRSNLHRLVAQRLKTICEPCEQELATELALHFEEGRDYEEAIRYLILGAENAAGRFAYRDSIEILHHARELLAKLSPRLRAEIEVRVLELIGDAQFALGALPESAQSYEAAATQAEQAGLQAAQVRALICAMYPLGFFDPGKGIAALDQAVDTSMRLGDTSPLAQARRLAASCRLVFDNWSREDAALCSGAHETLRRLGESGADFYQQVCYAHVLILEGKYHDALQILEVEAPRMDRGTKLIAHFGALSGKVLVVLRRGQLGEALRITQAGKELAHENRARSWLLSFGEAWLRIMALDFAGALRICETISGAPGAEYPSPQWQTISWIAEGYLAQHRGEYEQAVKHFRKASDPEVPAKFFLHWIWRLTAQLETSNIWLQAGNTSNARSSADRFLESALSSADPHLRALAWDLHSRVAIAEQDWRGAQEGIAQALAIVEEFDILVAAWQVHATAWQLYQRTNEAQLAETNRGQAEACILKIANSFAPDEPLRASFLCAPPVARVLAVSANVCAAR